MSGASIEKELVKGLMCHSSNDSALKNLFKEYYELLLSCYGPFNYMLIENSVGGNTLTSSSATLVSQLQIFHPGLKFINALIEAQNKSFGLYGSYIGILCSGVIMKCIDLQNDGYSQRSIGDIVECILEKLLNYLESAPQAIVYNINVGKIDSLLSFIKTILYSKLLFSLPENEKDHFAFCIAKAFLKTVPDDESASSFGKVHLKTADISCVEDSKVYDGILYTDPGFYDAKFMRTVVETSMNHKVVLFNVPLAFHSEPEETVTWLGEGNRNDVFIQQLLKKIKILLIKYNITVLLNQKVIDSFIKYDLEKSGIIVLERLGTSFTKSIIKLSGCTCITEVGKIEQVTENFLGTLSRIEMLNIGDHDYLLLSDDEAKDVTITIPAKDVHLEEYLQTATNNCLTGLRLLVQDPRGIAGGGCFEAHVVSYLTTLLHEDGEAIAIQHDVSISCVEKVFKIIKDVYAALANQLSDKSIHYHDKYIDFDYKHLWTKKMERDGKVSNCACNLINTSSEVTEDSWPSLWTVNMGTTESNFDRMQLLSCADNSLSKLNFTHSVNEKIFLNLRCDLFCAKVNATNLAFEGLSQILKIGYYIFDS